MKKIILFLIISIGFFSCKEDKKQGSNVPIVMEVEQQVNKGDKVEDVSLLEEPGLKVIMDFETDKAGIFQIKFRSPDKSKKPIVKYHSIKNRNTPNKIEAIYNLEKNEFPLYVQLILGGEEEKQVKVNSIKLITNEIFIEVDKDNFLDYVALTKYVTYNPDKGILSSKSVEGIHIPAIMLNKKSLDLLNQ